MTQKKVKDVAEEIRVHMEQNKQACGGVHAFSVLVALYQLGYKVVIDESN